MRWRKGRLMEAREKENEGKGRERLWRGEMEEKDQERP